MNHSVAWTAPQPFWRSAPGGAPVPVAQPQILRFASDEFMEELLGTLERNPTTLPAYQAQAETWRRPLGGPVKDPQQWIEHPPARLLPLLRRRNAKAGTPALPQPTAANLPLKLYQPAHLRHYLVAGALVCHTPGLPDRAVDAGRQKVSFVLRRLIRRGDQSKRDPLPAPTHLADWDEHAWVLSGKTGEWRHVGTANLESASARLIAGEERLPMFPARFNEVAGQPRRLFVGSVPVGRRETYQSAQARHADPADDIKPMDPRIVQLHADVLAPWRALVNRARDIDGRPPMVIFSDADNKDLPQSVDRTVANLDRKQLFRLRSEVQLSSWYVLLDLRAYLEQHFNGYVNWLDANPTGEPVAGTTEAALHNLLMRVATPADMRTMSGGVLSLTAACEDFGEGQIAAHLPDALRRIADNGPALEIAMTGTTGGAERAFLIPIDDEHVVAADDTVAGYTFGWPDFLFLFVDPWFDVPTPAPDAQPPGANDYGAERLQAQIDGLADRIAGLLPTLDPAKSLSEPTLASMAPADMREAWYVMRLVYERPDCAPFEGTVVSHATVPFQMAGFFDPDAPARPIRIGLPMDISPAGLRKFDKNAVFMMSDMLCGQIDRFKGISFGDLVLSVLPWPFHKDLSLSDKGPCKDGGDPLGVMCSLSIPIITICALILLTVIVGLLDLIFRWLPMFVVCFPFPGFRGKKDGP